MPRHIKLECPKCNRFIGSNNHPKHVPRCEGKKSCPVCSKEYTGFGKTCGYSCSNKLFRTGKNNGNWKEHKKDYRTICFSFHKKECIVCGENKIVAVHHLNENHNDNSPKNLIPLCPTHHQYLHSRYKDDIMPQVEKYLSSWE